MKIKIGNRIISENSKPLIVAEIGINHNGSIRIAKQLIALAKKYDFDAVKFQKRDPNICVPDLFAKDDFTSILTLFSLAS